MFLFYSLHSTVAVHKTKSQIKCLDYTLYDFIENILTTAT